MTIRTRSRLTNKLLIIKTLLVFLVCVIIVSADHTYIALFFHTFALFKSLEMINVSAPAATRRGQMHEKDQTDRHRE